MRLPALLIACVAFTACTRQQPPTVQAQGPDTAELKSQISELERQNKALENDRAGLKQANEALTQQVNDLQAKFSKQTWLYEDGGFLTSEQRHWVIPADITPTYVGGYRAEYSHYDPKTDQQTEHHQAQR